MKPVEAFGESPVINAISPLPPNTRMLEQPPRLSPESMSLIS